VTTLRIHPEGSTRWDGISLGEVMLRLDPGPTRVRAARSFEPWEGGGEYNVTKALSATFGHRTAVVTALVDNEVGRLVESLMRSGGVDTRYVRWAPFDGIGREARVGLNFTERGFGPRPARGVYDRGHTAIANLRPGEIDWETIFGSEGARWFHTGGIYAALSEHAPAVLEEAMEAAKANGTVISYDLNYREGLWRSQGGRERAVEVNRRLARFVDVMIGNEEDFIAALGFEVADLDPDLTELDPANFQRMIEQVRSEFDHLAVVATTLRAAHTANVNDWGAVLHADDGFHEATPRRRLEIQDRVGGGDGFASGMIHAFLSGRPPAEAVEWGCTHGALVMSTPGDTSMVSAPEVEAAIGARGARAVR
jgi:2-dehydro-3-deoxygluconokinase